MKLPTSKWYKVVCEGNIMIPNPHPSLWLLPTIFKKVLLCFTCSIWQNLGLNVIGTVSNYFIHPKNFEFDTNFSHIRLFLHVTPIIQNVKWSKYLSSLIFFPDHLTYVHQICLNFLLKFQSYVGIYIYIYTHIIPSIQI